MADLSRTSIVTGKPLLKEPGLLPSGRLVHIFSLKNGLESHCLYPSIFARLPGAETVEAGHLPIAI